MALILDKHAPKGGAHRGVIAAAATGIFTFRVSPGRRYNMTISNNTGGTYAIGYYLFSAEDDVKDGMTRNFMSDITGVTAAQKNAVSVIGMLELGINISVASSTELRVELRECKI